MENAERGAWHRAGTQGMSAAVVMMLRSQNHFSEALKPAGDTEPKRQCDASSFWKGGVFRSLGADYCSVATPVHTLLEDWAELTGTVGKLTAMTGPASQV